MSVIIPAAAITPLLNCPSGVEDGLCLGVENVGVVVLPGIDIGGDT